jgi:hypothetical protein
MLRALIVIPLLIAAQAAAPSPASKSRAAPRPKRVFCDFLFSGLDGMLEGKVDLLILPGGILAFVPFEALVTPGGSYLVETFHVRYAQSLTVMDILSEARLRAMGKSSGHAG